MGIPRGFAICRSSVFFLCRVTAAVLILVFSVLSAVGQQQPGKTPQATTNAPADYAKEALVFDSLTTKIREEADGTGTRETTARVRVLADAGVKDLAVLSFTYTAMNQQIDIVYVRVIKPDGTVVTTPDYNVQDMPADVTREAPMYSDIHQKHVAVKGLGAGDTLEYKLTLRTLKPEAPGHFWLEYSFEKNIVVLNEVLDLDVPADKQVTVASADVQPSVTTTGGRKLYHWVSKNLQRPDPDAPPKSTKNQKPSVQVTTFASWEQVGDWYKALEKDQVAVTPAIQAKADALVKGLTTEDEKIKVIFDAVALHIHYVGLDFGIGRYQPHPADDVLSNEYGDCKDKHTLLAALLKAEGIEAWPVLIPSSRDLDPATPSPGQFDHVITVVPRGSELTWMDSTAEIAPVGVLFATLRDKQALAVPDSKPARLERTPADLPYLQQTRFDATGKLSDQGEFTARLTQSYRGDAEMIMRVALRSVPEANWTLFFERFFRTLGFAGDVKQPEVSPVEATDQPLRVALAYTREKFGDWDDRRIIPAMPPMGVELAPGVKDTKPADDVVVGSPGEQSFTSKIELPKGWTAFPEPGTDLVEDWAEYHSKYSFAGGVYSAERRLVIKKNKLPLGDWDKYVKFRVAIYEDEVRMASLGSPAMTYDTSGAPVPVEGFSNTRFLAMSEQIQPVRDAESVLEAEPQAAKADRAKAAEACIDTTAKMEAKSQELAADDSDALYQAQLLGMAWTCVGWAKLDQKDAAGAENYLRPAWKLSQSPLAGLELGRLLEQKGAKPEAAHVYELAYISTPAGAFDIASAGDLHEKIASAYQKLTGRKLEATPLNHGQYDGSLRAQLDKDIEIHGYVKATKLSGQAYFSVTYENDKPVKAAFIGGEKALAPLASMLESHRFAVTLPAGSKARLVREVKLICSPWGGCDAYMMLPGAVERPLLPVKVKGIQAPPPQETKTIRVTKE